MIQVKAVTKKYISGTGGTVASDHICLEFGENGMYMILGKSGCGKTTLLNLLGGFDECDTGEILINGKDIASFSKEEMDEYHNLRMGVIFQQFNMIPELTVYDNLRLVLDIQELSEQKIEERIQRALQYVGLPGYEKRKISEVSGGEHQRIAVARTLVKEPEIILADEPSGNLDAVMGESLFQLLKDLSQKYVVIVVTHDADAAYRYGDFIITMGDGRVQAIEENIAGQTGCFSFSVKNHAGDIEKYHTKTAAELARVLSAIFRRCGEEDELKIGNITVEKALSKEASTGQLEQVTRSNTREMPRKRRWKLAAIFLNKKKYRCLFTVLICALTFVLLYFSAYIAFYDENKIMTEYLEQYTPQILPIYQTVSYVDPFSQVQEKECTSGRKLREKVFPEFSGCASVLEYIPGLDVYYEQEEYLGFSDSVTLLLNEGNAEYELEQGKSAESVGEAAVTDYLALTLGVSVGDCIRLDNIAELRVCGIIKTDYFEYKSKQGLNWREESEYFQFYMNYKYNVVYMNQEAFMEEICSKKAGIRLTASDFSCSEKEILYFEYPITFCGMKNSSEMFCLLAGSLPKSDSEIIISNGYAERIMQSADWETLIGTHVSFKDIYDEQYNDYWEDTLNLYDYFPEGATIVGIFQDGGAGDTVYLSDTQWAKLQWDYYENYYTSVALAPKGTAYKQMVEKADEGSIRYEEPGLLCIYAFSDALDELSWMLYTILGFAVVLNTAVIFVFANISIKENTKNIGILRSLGVTGKQSRNIFEVEFRMIFLLSVMFGVFLICILMKYVNAQYQADRRENPFSIVGWNVLILGIVFAAEYLISYLGAYLPIRRLTRKRIIELLRA